MKKKSSKDERNIEIFKSLIKGQSAKEAALENGISRERITQVTYRVKRLIIRMEYQLGRTIENPYSLPRVAELDQLRGNADFWLAKANELLMQYKA